MKNDDESETHYSEMYTVRGSFIDKTYKANKEEFKLCDSNDYTESSKLLQKE